MLELPSYNELELRTRKVYLFDMWSGGMKIHQSTTDRINWLEELYLEILNRVKDPEIAKIIYRRVLFEEK